MHLSRSLAIAALFMFAACATERIAAPPASAALPNAALMMVDGTVLPRGSKVDLKADIASVQVLKGAAAFAAYGAEGRNGVVRITTRSASATRQMSVAAARQRRVVHRPVPLV